MNMKLYIILSVWCAQNYFHESVLEPALKGMLAQWIKSLFFPNVVFLQHGLRKDAGLQEPVSKNAPGSQS